MVRRHCEHTDEDESDSRFIARSKAIVYRSRYGADECDYISIYQSTLVSPSGISSFAADALALHHPPLPPVIIELLCHCYCCFLAFCALCCFHLDSIPFSVLCLASTKLL